MVLAHKLEAKLIILFIMEKFPIVLPRQRNGSGVQLPPASISLQRTYDTTISSATNITLNISTSIIEVTAINNGIFLKYGSNASSSDFDEFILADSTRHFVVPAGVTVISIIEETASAKAVVIEK